MMFLMIAFLTFFLASGTDDGCSMSGTLRAHGGYGSRRFFSQTAARIGDEFIFGFAAAATTYGMLSVDLEGIEVSRKYQSYRQWTDVPTVVGEYNYVDISSEEKIELWNTGSDWSWSGARFDLFNLTMSEGCPSAVEDCSIADRLAASQLKTLDGGQRFNCGIQESGQAYCFGDFAGKDVTPPSDGDLTAIGVGQHYGCALKEDASIVCWGEDVYNQVSDTPTETGFTQICTGIHSACALRSDKTMVCWGNDMEDKVSGVPVDETFASMICGWQGNCGIKEDGSLQCWGSDRWVVNFPTDTGFIQGDMGDIHACVLNENGAITSWGSLTAVTDHTPTDTDFKRMCSGTYHCCGIHEDGRITCFVRNSYGNPVVSGTPTSAGHKDIICGNFHTCALQADDKWNCWGQEFGDSAVFPGDEFPDVPVFRVRENECATGTESESEYKLSAEWTGHFQQNLCSQKSNAAVSADGNTVAFATGGTSVYSRGSEHVQVLRRASKDEPWMQLGSQNIPGYNNGPKPSFIPVKDFGIGMDYQNWGKAIAMSANGETIVVGANAGYRGMVQVFQWSDSQWVLKGQSIHHGQTDRIYTSFGSHVSISGDGNTFAMASGTSHVQVFQFDGSQWVQKGTSDDANPYGELSRQFPNAVESQLSYDGNVLALFSRSGLGEGSVHRFEDGDWIEIGSFEGIQGEGSQRAYLQNMRLSADGNTIAYNLVYHRWGRADELDNEFHNRVKIFKLEDGEWVPFAEDIVVNHPNFYHDYFGHNLDISDDARTIVVAATKAGHGDSNLSEIGYFEVYRLENGVYVLKDRTERQVLKKFAENVQISGDGSVLVVGSDHDLNHYHNRSPSNEGVCSIYDGLAVTAIESESPPACPEPAPESILLQIDGYRGEPIDVANLVAQVLFDAGHGDRVSLVGATTTLERN